MLEFYIDERGPSQSRTLTPSGHQLALPFHLINIGSFCMGENYFTRRDGLNNCLLIITTEGRGRLTWLGQTCDLLPGSAVLIDCNTYHEYRTAPGEHWNFEFLHFGALSMEGYRGALLDALTPVRLRSPSKAKAILDEMQQVSDRNNVAADVILSNQISSLLTEIICSLAEETEERASLNRRDIAELAEFIRKNFVEDLHLDDFMKVTRLSRYYLIHTFERQIGVSPYRYLHMCRINYAQKLLRTTDLTISEITYSVGYNHPAVFIRHFKSFHGVAPGTYRSESVRLGLQEF